jgi:predicted P-loop ATPase
MTATLLGLPPQIAADQRFLIVDTERAAGSAASLLPAYTVLRPSLDGALDDIPVDALFALQGSDVLIWPSNIPATRTAAELLANRLAKLTDRLRMVYVNGVDPPFFSATDMAGWEPKAVVAWARERTRTWEVTQPHVAPELPQELQPDEDDVPRETHNSSEPYKKSTPTSSPFVIWESLALDAPRSGLPYPHTENLMRILGGHPELVGRIWYDEFHGRIFSDLFDSSPAEWRDDYDTRLLNWIINHMHMPKVNIQNVRLSIEAYARMNVRNEPADWMRGLRWDRVERLPTLMTDVWGTPQNDYTAAVGRCWLTSIAARVLQPGCQVDYMPVFEGPQGLRKSTALRILGGKFFAEAHESVLSKDFYQNLQGKMLLEVTEMESFTRAEVNRVKQVITCRDDRYRASYGRRSEDHPRRCVFGGTTNRDDWVRDDTGARRFWPIACGDVEPAYLTHNRDQLFAEAVSRFTAGELYHDVPLDLATAEQDARREPDLWTASVMDYCDCREFANITDILRIALNTPIEKQGKHEQMRVASILRVAGWKKQRTERLGRNTQFWFAPRKSLILREDDFKG